MLIFSSYVEAKCLNKPTVIAVIDTGFGYFNKGHEAKLCQFGHKDFTIDRKFDSDYGTIDPIPTDVHAHGTNVIGLIDNYLKGDNNNYCIVVLKFYSLSHTGKQNIEASIKAIEYATNIRADFINYSGGGPEWVDSEFRAVHTFLDSGGTFVAAAGNNSQNLGSLRNSYYPAMYDSRVIIVGNMSLYGVRSKTSNYGKIVKYWEYGENASAYGITMTGTSQATAIKTGKTVRNLGNKCDIGKQ